MTLFRSSSIPTPKGGIPHEWGDPLKDIGGGGWTPELLQDLARDNPLTASARAEHAPNVDTEPTPSLGSVALQAEVTPDTLSPRVDYSRRVGARHRSGGTSSFVTRTVTRVQEAVQRWADTETPYRDDADIMTDYKGTPQPRTLGRAAMVDYDIPAAARGTDLSKLQK